MNIDVIYPIHTFFKNDGYILPNNFFLQLVIDNQTDQDTDRTFRELNR